MQLTIAPNRKIGDIQQDFNRMFPFLKIEFLNHKSIAAPKSAKQIIPANKTIGDSQRSVTDGALEIDGNMKVQELEKLFHDQFSLAVQVFRKSGPVWLETTMTDNWTLQQQNKHGSELSTEKPKEKPGDFDLERDNS